MKIAITALLIGLLLALYAYSYHPYGEVKQSAKFDGHEEWFRCQSDHQCELVSDCYLLAANKDYSEQVFERAVELHNRAGEECSFLDIAAKCIDDECVAAARGIDIFRAFILAAKPVLVNDVEEVFSPINFQ